MIARVADAVLTVVLAPTCAACGTLLDEPTRGPVCPACWRAILRITPPWCDTCGDPLPPAAAGATVCSRCHRSTRALDRGRTVGVYDGSLREIIHALKYDARRSLARPLGLLMRAAGADLLHGAACAVPVPLHPSRQRSRGFNQARDLARELGLPVCDALRRTRATAPQIDLPAVERQRNVCDAFAARAAAAALRGRIVVLVDDVSTTGATLDACARVLKQAGAREVRAITAARAVATRP